MLAAGPVLPVVLLLINVPVVLIVDILLDVVRVAFLPRSNHAVAPSRLAVTTSDFSGETLCTIFGACATVSHIAAHRRTIHHSFIDTDSKWSFRSEGQLHHYASNNFETTSNAVARIVANDGPMRCGR